MGYRLMLDVARRCLLYSDRSNKSVSYRQRESSLVANVKNTHFQDGALV